MVNRLIISVSIFILITTSFTKSAFAQGNEWVNVEALYEGTKGIMEVNVSLKDDTLFLAKPFLVMTAVKMQKSTDAGLPSDEELPMLNAFVDSAKTLLNKSVNFEQAGNFTHNGVRINYFYSSDTLGLRQKITDLYAQAFPNYTLGLTFKYEPRWQTYFEFIYPGEEIIDLLKNKQPKK